MQTIIGVNPWALHRNRDVFGPDAEDFRPERWLEDNQGDLRSALPPLRKSVESTDPFPGRNFFAFGAGSRTCLGKSESSVTDWRGLSLLLTIRE